MSVPFTVARGEESGAIATLATHSGMVRVLRAGETKVIEAIAGMKLSAGDRLILVSGKARLVFPGTGHVLCLSKLTTIEIRPPFASAGGTSRAKSVFVRLITGRVRALVHALSPDEDFIVSSDTVISAVKGTDYVFDGLVASVLDEGDMVVHEVELTTQNGGKVTVKEGQSGGFRADGTVMEPAPVELAIQEELKREFPLEPEKPDKTVSGEEAGAGSALSPGSLGSGMPVGEERTLGAMRSEGLEVERRDLAESREMAASAERQEQLADSILGWVVTDMHGYRVRVEEYIYRPTAETVEALFLNSREGGPNAGLTMMADRTTYNKVLPKDFIDATRGVESAMANPAAAPEYWKVRHQELFTGPSGDSLRTLTEYGSPALTCGSFMKTYDSGSGRWTYSGESVPVAWGQSLIQSRYVGTAERETLKERFVWSRYLDLERGWYAGAAPASGWPGSAVEGFRYAPNLDNPATAADEGLPFFGNALFGTGARTQIVGGGARTWYGDGTVLTERYWYVDRDGHVLATAGLFGTAEAPAEPVEANIEWRVEATEFAPVATGEAGAIDIVIDPRPGQ